MKPTSSVGSSASSLSSPRGSSSARGASLCRCDDLRATFGEYGAPKLCGPCALNKRREQLIRDGWRDVPRSLRLAYLDCGIAIETTSDGVTWAPCWAATLVDVALEKPWLGRVLMRAAVDLEFRDAALTVVCLTNAEDDPVHRLHQFATSSGIDLA